MLERNANATRLSTPPPLGVDAHGGEDRRWSPRKAVGLRVVVFVQGTVAALGRTRDVGLEGMFVEALPVEITENSLVEVEFAIDDATGAERQRLSALVIRRGDDGLALMFLSFNRRVFQAFQRLIYA